MAKDVVVMFLTRGLSLVLGIMVSALLARLLGPALKGSYDIAVLIIKTSVMVVSLGISSANVYLGAKEPQRLAAFIGNSVVVAGTIGILVIAALNVLVIVPSVKFYLLDNGIVILHLRLLLGLIPVVLLQSYLQEIVRAAGHILLYGLLNATRFFINLVLIILLLLSPSSLLSAAFLAWALAEIIVLVFTSYLTLKATNFRVRWDYLLLKRSLRFGLQLHPGNLAQFLNYRLDIFIIALFLTPDEVAFYATATLLAERLWEIPTTIRTALLFHVSSRPDQAVRITAQTCRVLVLVTTPTYFVILLIAKPAIILVFGSDFLPTVQPFLFLLPGVWISSLSKIVGMYLASSGRPLTVTWSAFISLLFTIGLDIVLIPIMGISGAAIASSVSYTVISVLLIALFIHRDRVRLQELFVPQHADKILFMRLLDMVSSRFLSKRL